MNYADFVEIRIQELINEDRMRRGVKRFSPEADELAQADPPRAGLAGDRRRSWRPRPSSLVAVLAGG